jgi:TonB family protein
MIRKPEYLPGCASHQVFGGKAVKVIKNPVLLPKTGIFIFRDMKIRIQDKIGTSNLKISAFISLGIHLFFILTVSVLLLDIQVRQAPIRFVKVALYHWEKEPRSNPEPNPPLPVRHHSQRPEIKKLIQERKQPAFNKEFEPPVPLPIQATERNVPAEESIRISPSRDDEKIATEPATLTVVAALNTDLTLKRDENPPLLREPLSTGEHQSVPFTSSPQGVMHEETLSIALSGKPEIGQEGSSGGSPGNGSGQGKGRFRWKGFGEGMGQGGSGGGGSGNGPATGTGSGHGDSRGGGSRMGTGIFAKLISSSAGGGGTNPRYAKNPKPPYPQEARERGYQGEVLLRVEVLSNGRVGQIEVKRSSGHDILDQSAFTTVKQWKFVPAKRGEDTVSSWVNIPIKFQLQ